MKRFVLVMLIACIPLVLVVGQSSTAMTVEESYLRETLENTIIREQSRMNNREMKMLALTIIGEAIERGNKSDDVCQALEYMGLEGTLNRAREGGRLSNNFPDVRRESAKYLGQLGTVEAKEVLMAMIYYENEPMVLQEAIKSLGDIGIDENGRTIDTIAWIYKKFDNTRSNPEDLKLLAFVTVDALEKLIVKNKINDPNAIQILSNIIADGRYGQLIQNRAMIALQNIRKGQTQDQQRR